MPQISGGVAKRELRCSQCGTKLPDNAKMSQHTVAEHGYTDTRWAFLCARHRQKGVANG